MKKINRNNHFDVRGLRRFQAKRKKEPFANQRTVSKKRDTERNYDTTTSDNNRIRFSLYRDQKKAGAQLKAGDIIVNYTGLLTSGQFDSSFDRAKEPPLYARREAESSKDGTEALQKN